jgi:Second Messenger Oligonucleotide or Dinucleotide Synthetase domain
LAETEQEGRVGQQAPHLATLHLLATISAIPILFGMNGLGLANSFLSNSVHPHEWAYVTKRFQALQAGLRLQTEAVDDARTKLYGIVKTLNRAFRGESTVGHYLLAGSWGKNTAIHPPTDVDLCFFLPDEIFYRFNTYSWNKQSQLLGHVKDVLTQTYPQTTIRQDGQVVVVAFNSLLFEVVPSFRSSNRGLITCDTNEGGRWKLVDPFAEIQNLDQSDSVLNGNQRKLVRIFKQWKRHCDVPIKSFHLEWIIGDGLARIDWGKNSEFWFDWIVRDVFAYLITRAGGGFAMPGGFNEWIDVGDAWKAKAETAYMRAVRACEYERLNMNLAAGGEWQKIFGAAIPEMVI